MNDLPNSSSLLFVEEIYADYERDPQSVPEDWRAYFDSLSQNLGRGENGSTQIGPTFSPSSIFNPGGSARLATEQPKETSKPAKNAENAPDYGARRREAVTEQAKARQEAVTQLVRNYRVRGHLLADLDPLGFTPVPDIPELQPEFYGFTEQDMERTFACDKSIDPSGMLPLRELIARLKNTYSRTIGVQFTHIDDIDARNWLQQRMESTQNRLELSRKEQIRILTRLTDAVAFEEFIRRKFTGAKSFSLEGAESLLPLLDLAIEEAGEQGVQEIVMGMAHRGRLNVLANIIGKSAREIFREFEDKDPDLHVGGGDVKYHLGYVNDWQTSSGRKVHLALCFNPSHLEFVNTVAMGRLRAKQDRIEDNLRERGFCILIHGDAAFAGEGVVQETLNLSQLPGYTVGGTLHVIINNQIGFTTGPSEARSSHYCTDVAKMLQIPIFHVNGEDPEAVAATVKMAMDFRREFARDAVIDMYGYRKLGHNEGDEPAFTQPLIYAAIAKRKPVREAYLDRLLKLGGVTREEADAIAERRRQQLETELSEAHSEDYVAPNRVRRTHGGYIGGLESEAPDIATGVPKERLSMLLEQLVKVPDDFHPHPKITRILKARSQMAKGEAPLDWAAGEALAFATLATEGVPIRLTGQDSERGTFSHRHAVLHDVENDAEYTPLLGLSREQARIEIHNSPLSEIGVLGFEYGYSLDFLGGLCIWEAQFGDFWNTAQVIVDQFIVSAEDKWQHLSGLVMLLPHGYEGAGPEHSSARPERFLLMGAEDNIQVCYPTTPAQMFHLMRRQVLRKWRKPLVVMSPKSLLRHLECISSLEDFEIGTFQRVLPDTGGRVGPDVKKVLLCTGKIYYELDKEREARQANDVAILRVEQLYPLAQAELEKALESYAPGTKVVWVQEEPENMGAWRHFEYAYRAFLNNKFEFSGSMRPRSASPATGSASSHKKEQQELIDAAFDR
ncbi:MAG TPA: 2-oxoglutarate dehydrogenase E1 component [Abditibacterium sp.]|jgi:2-oxoglutarate dehydrogenase E1 component